MLNEFPIAQRFIQRRVSEAVRSCPRSKMSQLPWSQCSISRPPEPSMNHLMEQSELNTTRLMDSLQRVHRSTIALPTGPLTRPPTRPPPSTRPPISHLQNTPRPRKHRSTILSMTRASGIFQSLETQEKRATTALSTNSRATQSRCTSSRREVMIHPGKIIWASLSSIKFLITDPSIASG